VYVTGDELRRVQRIYRHLRGIAGHNVKPYSDLATTCPQIRYFTVLRDPVARYLSHFKNRAHSYDRAGFERWAGQESMRNFQTRTLAGEANLHKAIDLIAQRVGFVGLTEAIGESLLMLGQWLGDPDFRPEYRPVNRLADKERARDVARAQADLSYLDAPEVRDRLMELNALDQQLYDFAVREHFARQRQAYTGDLAADVAALHQRNQQVTDWREPLSGRLLRNWVYKPALVLHLA
jgi:Sulfotransferase family